MVTIGKRPRDTGGSYYRGYALTVLATQGDYVLDMTITDSGCAISGITVIPDEYGELDHFKLELLDTNSVRTTKGLIAENIYNVGKGAAIELDFPSLQIIDAGYKFRLTYTNVAGMAMTVYTIVERTK